MLKNHLDFIEELFNISKKTLLVNEHKIIENLDANKAKLSIHIDRKLKYIPKNLIAAGPSLSLCKPDDNLQYACVDMALKYALERGFNVTTVLSIDVNFNIDLTNVDTSNILLICPLAASKSIVRQWKGPIVVANFNSITAESSFYANYLSLEPLINLFSGLCVGNSLIYISLMYNEEIFLNGFDYCAYKNKYYPWDNGSLDINNKLITGQLLMYYEEVKKFFKDMCYNKKIKINNIEYSLLNELYLQNKSK